MSHRMAVEDINSVANIANSLSSTGVFDVNPSTRNDVEKAGDTITFLATGVGAFVPGLAPFVAAFGAALSVIGGLSG
jgi:hypothetical protein